METGRVPEVGASAVCTIVWSFKGTANQSWRSLRTANRIEVGVTPCTVLISN